MKVEKPKIQAIDIMRTVSIASVILIHTTTKVLEAAHYDLLTFWPTLFLNQVARFAVPLFFLISGFLLELNYGNDLDFKTYLKKRFSKIFIPYIFWSLFYYYFIYTQNTDNLLRVFLTGNASYQLYFIPAICIFYLLFPLLHKIYKYIINIPVLLILTVAEIYLMNQDYFVKQFGFADPIRIFLLAYIFFILGMAAARSHEAIEKIVVKIKYLLIPLALFAAFYIFEEGKSRYFTTYNIEAFYSQWRPDILIYTLIVALIFLGFFAHKSKSAEFLSKLSKLSYLVFFIHVIFLEEIWKYFGLSLWKMLNGNMFGIAAFDVLFFVLIAGASFCTAKVVHKIPFVSKITG